MLANLFTLAVQFLLLLAIVAFVVSLFSGKSGTAAAAGDAGGTVSGDGGKPPFGRWETPTERDQYFRQRGHSTNWME